MDLLKKKEVDDKNEQSKVLSTNDFRHRGNNYFNLNDFKAAIDEYSSGIKLEPNNITLLSNRAEAYLRLNQFRKALNDVEIVLNYECNHLKATFRKGKALCGLKRYQDAIITFQILLQIMQANNHNDNALIRQDTEKLLKHAIILDSENRIGQYNYLHIVDEFCEKVKIKETNQGNDDWVCK